MTEKNDLYHPDGSYSRAAETTFQKVVGTVVTLPIVPIVVLCMVVVAPLIWIEGKLKSQDY